MEGSLSHPCTHPPPPEPGVGFVEGASQGQGWRLALTCRSDVGRWWTGWAPLSCVTGTTGEEGQAAVCPPL